MNFIDQELEDYAISHSTVPSTICDELEAYTKQNVEMPQMLIGKMEASFLGFLIRSAQVKHILEIGTFTGYSAMAMASHLPEDGHIITIDVNQKTTLLAKEYWKKAGLDHKITGVNKPALDYLNQDLAQRFDLIFIDADKQNYLNYLKKALDILTPNGFIVLDNVLWGGRVLESNPQDTSTIGIKEVNHFVSEQKNLFGTMLPVRDGMFLIKKI